MAGGALGLIGIFVVVWWVQKKHRMEGEVSNSRREESQAEEQTLAFSRLSKRDQAAFLADNPQSRLNPEKRRRPRYASPSGPLPYASWYWNQVQASQQGQMAQGGLGQGMMGPSRSRFSGRQGYPMYSQTVGRPLMG